MVVAGGSVRHGYGSPEFAGMHDVRQSSIFSSQLSRRTAFLLLAAAVAAVTAGVLVAVSSDQSVVLSEKEIHDLHLANSLKDALNKGPDPSIAEDDNAGSDIHLGEKDHELTTLSEARKQAEKRVRVIAARHKMDAAHSEELILKERLDAETREKQRADLKGRMSRSQVESVMSLKRGAERAKELHVDVAKLGGKSGSYKEEEALKNRLDQEAKQRQELLFRKTASHLSGFRSVGEAAHLVHKAQLSESELEKELRSQLDKRVKNKQEGLYKSAMQHWLLKQGVTGDKSTAKQLVATTAAGGGGGHANSLAEAERLMKMTLSGGSAAAASELRRRRHADTTLSHAPLESRAQAARRKKAALANLEAAMLRASMAAARRDAPKIQAKHDLKAKLRAAAVAAAAARRRAHPTYTTAMLRFTKRLVTKEHKEAAAADAAVKAELKHRMLPGGAAASAAGGEAEAAAAAAAPAAAPKSLMAVIKDKVQAKLVEGSPALRAARAKLDKEFSGSNSLFTKTERAALKELRARRKVQERELAQSSDSDDTL